MRVSIKDLQGSQEITPRAEKVGKSPPPGPPSNKSPIGVEFKSTLDWSKVEASVETEFTRNRNRAAGAIQSPAYPFEKALGQVAGLAAQALR